MTATLRPAELADLAAILEIQASTPTLSQWSADSLAGAVTSESYGLDVVEADGAVTAFLLWRALPADETEILSLAVAGRARRQGFAELLLRRLFDLRKGEYFLEVRSSNAAALALYQKLGFQQIGLRREYYHRPVEDAVLMRRAENLRKDGSSTR